eukprot:6768218-Prymnesium_polylepis.1
MQAMRGRRLLQGGCGGAAAVRRGQLQQRDQPDVRRRVPTDRPRLLRADGECGAGGVRGRD